MSARATRLRIGFIPLCDAAALIVAAIADDSAFVKRQLCPFFALHNIAAEGDRSVIKGSGVNALPASSRIQATH